MTLSLLQPAEALLTTAVDLFRAGGGVMWPLLVTGLLLAYLLGLRAVDFATLTRLPLPDGPAKPAEAGARLRTLLREAGPRAVGQAELMLRQHAQRLERGGAVIETLVVAAPLLGLLGTVRGMVTTFEALTDMALFSQSGGVAGGIAEALVTTQMGLGIAIPGLLAHRLLERRARRLRGEAEAAVDACRALVAPPQEEA